MDKQILEELVDQGLSTYDIAQTIGCSQTNIRHYLRKYNLKTERSRSRRRWTDEQLIEAAASSDSIAQVVRKLGLSDTAAGNWKTVSKYVESLQLDTSHWVGKRWVSTRTEKPGRFSIEEIFVENSNYPTSKLLKRLLDENLKVRVCEFCGLDTWLGQPIAIEVDHINGIPTDHRLANLRLLCPNCHAQTPTWRGRKNKMPG